ncbi:MAG: hypothetical protein ACD_75C02624G0008 [uncultured bacterium]|nr:MAG: hypothetical protein ACD_75C02624G0008 [uncultured bacterium]
MARCLDQVDDFTFLGKSAKTLFGKHRIAIGNHLENPSRRRQQLYFCPESSLQLVPQTGGTWLVISLCAVFNGNFHVLSFVL